MSCSRSISQISRPSKPTCSETTSRCFGNTSRPSTRLRGSLSRWLDRQRARYPYRPIVKLGKTLRDHRELLLNWFRARGELALGAVEGLNKKARVTTKLAYGFRSYEHAEIALFHRLGKLPEPPCITHRFMRGASNRFMWAAVPSVGCRVRSRLCSSSAETASVIPPLVTKSALSFEERWTRKISAGAVMRVHVDGAKRQRRSMHGETKVEIVEVEGELFVEADATDALEINGQKEAVKNDAGTGRWAVRRPSRAAI